jgi:hypothetical protein
VKVVESGQVFSGHRESAAFVDPQFSAGVALATSAGGVRAKIVAVVIRRPKIETAALERCARAYRNFFEEIRMGVERLHGRTKNREFGFGPASGPVDPDHGRTPSANSARLIS